MITLGDRGVGAADLDPGVAEQSGGSLTGDENRCGQGVGDTAGNDETVEDSYAVTILGGDLRIVGVEHTDEADLLSGVFIREVVEIEDGNSFGIAVEGLRILREEFSLQIRIVCNFGVVGWCRCGCILTTVDRRWADTAFGVTVTAEVLPLCIEEVEER